MHQSDSVTVGYHQLLYGRLAPHVMLERYETTDKELFHTLQAIPETPEAYLSAEKNIQKRWRQHVDQQNLRAWIPPFYALPEKKPAPFHPLCKFYRTFLHCESRLIIQTIKDWMKTLEVTLLRYELMILQQHLIGLLKECDRRLRAAATDKDSLPVNLARFMLNVLRNYLFITLFELRDRYGHMLAKRTVDIEALWVKHLHRSPPRQPFYYRTEEYTTFYLERALRPSGNISRIEYLLEEAHRDYEHITDEGGKQSLLRSIHRLENVWICYRLCVETGQTSPAELNNAMENRLRIEQWLGGLENEEAGNEQHINHCLPELLKQGPSVIKAESEHKASEAFRLLKKLQHMFKSSGGSGNVKEGTQYSQDC